MWTHTVDYCNAYTESEHIADAGSVFPIYSTINFMYEHT